MTIAALLVLLAPGLLVCKISSKEDMNSIGSVVKTIMTVLIDSFIVFIALYFTLNIIYGDILISFSSVYDANIPRSLFYTPFVWKYGLMSVAYAIALSMVKVLLTGFLSNKRSVRQ